MAPVRFGALGRVKRKSQALNTKPETSTNDQNSAHKEGIRHEVPEVPNGTA
jgi:hypothetical protein